MRGDDDVKARGRQKGAAHSANDHCVVDPDDRGDN